MPPACNTSPTTEQMAQEDTNKFHYYKDQETDLCFVLMDYSYATMQVVECTAQVESKINERLNR
jgi:hypothetical protein